MRLLRGLSPHLGGLCAESSCWCGEIMVLVSCVVSSGGLKSKVLPQDEELWFVWLVVGGRDVL